MVAVRALLAAVVLVAGSCAPVQTGRVQSADASGVVPFVARPNPSGPDVFGDLHQYAAVEPSLEEVPSDVAIGETLRFVVALRNPTDQDIRLTPCPTFYMAWGEDDVVVNHKGLLNCPDGPKSLPGQSAVRFEMKLVIEQVKYLRPGYPGKVFWRLTSSPAGNWDQSDIVAAKAP